MYSPGPGEPSGIEIFNALQGLREPFTVKPACLVRPTEALNSDQSVDVALQVEIVSILHIRISFRSVIPKGPQQIVE